MQKSHGLQDVFDNFKIKTIVYFSFLVYAFVKAIKNKIVNHILFNWASLIVKTVQFPLWLISSAYVCLQVSIYRNSMHLNTIFYLIAWEFVIEHKL